MKMGHAPALPCGCEQFIPVCVLAVPINLGMSDTTLGRKTDWLPVIVFLSYIGDARYERIPDRQAGKPKYFSGFNVLYNKYI